MIKFQGMEEGDKRFFIASILVPIVTWWVLIGRKRYGVRGMK